MSQITRCTFGAWAVPLVPQHFNYHILEYQKVISSRLKQSQLKMRHMPAEKSYLWIFTFCDLSLKPWYYRALSFLFIRHRLGGRRNWPQQWFLQWWTGHLASPLLMPDRTAPVAIVPCMLLPPLPTTTNPWKLSTSSSSNSYNRTHLVDLTGANP
jgi:hypothetical protein